MLGEGVGVLPLEAAGVVYAALASEGVHCGSCGHCALAEGVGLLRLLLLLLLGRLYRAAPEGLLYVLWECATGDECLLCGLRTVAAESSACVVCLHGLQLRRLSLYWLWLTEGVC